MLYKRLIIICQRFARGSLSTPVIQDPRRIVDGVNVLSAYSAIQLRAPGKDYVHLRGDFNGFAINNASLMHQSVDGTRHWLQVDGLNPYQYWRYIFN